MKIQERTGAGNQRSAAPAQPAMGERLPAPPRERKPALAALAVLLILVGALGATMLVLRAGDRVEVVQVTGDIQAGESVGKSVTSVLVADDASINYVKWSQVDTLKTLKAKSTIYKGTVVIGDMFASKTTLPAGKASVGLALKEGQYPANIKEGDVVAAYRVGNDSGSSSSRNSSSGSSSSSSSNSLIVDNARVDTKSDDSDATISTGNLSITLLVDQSDAPALTQAAAGGDVAVVLVPGNGN
ncbi:MULTISPECIES: hypothetical protein [unclassified Streptomyces]|uniref:hypothetical protein n=1 Tax=unclassified Streptomyces TaxID=2593676 RepID=UPI0033BE9B5E